MSVEARKEKSRKNHAKTLAAPDWSQIKFGWFFISSSGMKKPPWRNGVYQTNDGKQQEAVLCSRQSPCQPR